MACELTSGYDSFELCDTQGGVAEWYMFDRRNLANVNVTDNEVTSITLEAGKYAYPFLVEQETSSFTVDTAGEMANKSASYTFNATAVLHGNTADIITTVDNLVKGRTVWIAKLNDGTYEVLGLSNGLKVNNSRSSGTAFEDLNGNTLTATGKSPVGAPKIDSALVLALLAPAS